jgi:hypothetical protein
MILVVLVEDTAALEFCNAHDLLVGKLCTISQMIQLEP